METTTQKFPIEYRDYKIDRCEYKGFQFVHSEYDGPEDKRIGHASTIAECESEIDDQIICSLERQITRLERQIDKLQSDSLGVRQENIDKLGQALELAEAYKDDLETLTKEVAPLKTTITILMGFLSDNLKTIEEKFESNEDEFNFEQLRRYADAVRYMNKRNGVQGDHGTLKMIVDKLLALPY